MKAKNKAFGAQNTNGKPLIFSVVGIYVFYSEMLKQICKIPLSEAENI